MNRSPAECRPQGEVGAEAVPEQVNGHPGLLGPGEPDHPLDLGDPGPVAVDVAAAAG
jgi:hypothetical protein